MNRSGGRKRADTRSNATIAPAQCDGRVTAAAHVRSCESLARVCSRLTARRVTTRLDSTRLDPSRCAIHAGRVFSDDQRRAFEDDGFVRLRGVLSPADCEAMRARTWRQLERNGVDPDNRHTWSPEKAWKLQGIRRGDPPPAEQPQLRAALDALFEDGQWTAPRDWGQALVTMPSPGPWRIPAHVWHLDHPYTHPRFAIHGLNLFLLVDDVVAHGGGTLVVRSSHRVVDRFVESVEGLHDKKMKVLRAQFHARNPWFTELADAEAQDGADRTERYMACDTEVDGVGVRVVELTGEAGDVVLCHPWLVHNSAPNVQQRLRMMRACRVYHPSHPSDARTAVSSPRAPS